MPEKPTRLDQLRDAVQVQGGDWTTRRAIEVLDGWPTADRARHMLNRLADEGLLVKHGVRGRLWTPAPAGASGQPGQEPLGQSLRDVCDLADETARRITDAEVDARLDRLLKKTGHDDSP